MGAFWTDGQARMARRVSNFEQAQSAHDRWARCGNCGSQKVKSDASRDFQPTGSIVPTASGSPTSARVDAEGAYTQGVDLRQPADAASPAEAWRRDPSVWSRLCATYLQHWRIIWTALLLVAPFGSIGDPETYSGPVWLNILKFVGILFGSWCAAAFFFLLHRRHQCDIMGAPTSGGL
jgi:hypothetical protein